MTGVTDVAVALDHLDQGLHEPLPATLAESTFLSKILDYWTRANSQHRPTWQENSLWRWRIKSRWHDDDAERSLDEIAGALAFIGWRIAKDKAINLHGQDFVIVDDEQRFAVIVEYLIFQLQIVDRLALMELDLIDDDRRQLVVTLARHLAGHLHDNSVDIFGPGDYVGPFIEK